jgi:FkbM family methyltransferase
VYYSQNDEEKVILEYAQNIVPRRFLDIGAYDGIAFSNTYALYQDGWEGVYVEADPRCFERLKCNFQRDGRAVLWNKCVGSINGKVTFYSTDGMVSTTSKRHRDLWALCQTPYEEIVLDMIDVPALLRMAPGPYGFISIDVEGIDLTVLNQLDLRTLDTKLVCVECNYEEDRPAFRGFLASQGFRVVHETDENLIGVLEDALATGDGK